MKKFAAALLALVMVAGCSSTTGTTTTTPSSEGSMTAGTYTATGSGYHGDITIEVTVDETSITAINVVEENETEGIGKDALPTLVDEALTNQVAPVEAVSGATMTSDGFNTALLDALTQAGADLDAFAANGETTETTDKQEVEETTDVVVVGAGGAGLTAALTAQQNGKSVILLEKMGVAGGATSMAGGGTTATGSEWQKEDGYEDSPESLKADMLANGHNHNDEATLDIFVNTVGNAFDWLTSPEGGNVEYSHKEGGSRTYSATGRGAQVVATLSDGFTSGGGTLLTNTPATELLVEDGKVCGVKAESDDTLYTIHADSVILATGGFGANDEMVPEEYKQFVYAGAAGATGDGITMAQAVDADLINMEFVNTQPNSMILPSGLGQYTNPGVGAAYGVGSAFLVNTDGVRFTNESGNAWDLMQAMKQNETQYLIMDQASFDAFNTSMENAKIYTAEDVETWLANDGEGEPFMVQANDLAELGEKLGTPEGALEATVEQFNADAANGTDSYGRTINAPISEEGPYYALELVIRYYASLGGLHINENMQVLNTDQQPIDGLYAAGEVVGGLEGDVYYGGSLFGWAMTSGHNAGLAVSGVDIYAE